MNDLLWLANHPLWGNVTGILTGQNPNTLEGLESWLSIGIHRIPAELPHSIELELRELCRTWTDSGRASVLELLRGLPTSREVLWPSKSHHSLLYKGWTWELYRKLNLTFFTPFAGWSTGVFIGGLSQCFGRKWRSGGPLVRLASQLGWSGSQVSWPHHLWASLAYSTDLLWHVYETVFENMPNPGRPHFCSIGPRFCAMPLLLSYCLWICLNLDIMKRCMDFGPYYAFPSSDVPKMVNQQNLWNSLVISNYLLYLEWNASMLAVDICILWPPTPCHT
jgi:hypothetical protein